MRARWWSALALGATAAALAAPIGGGPALAGGPAPAGGWLFGGSAHGSLSDAVAQARAFDVIVAAPGAYRSFVPAMRAANPALRLYVYVNGTYAQANQGTAFPAAEYLTSGSGQRVRSRGYGNWLMNPADPNWVASRVNACREGLAASGYDGCYLDMLGDASVQAGYTTGTPLNPVTRAPWSAAGWLAASSALGATVARSLAPHPVIGNGLQSGPSYYAAAAPSRQLLSGIDGGVAEDWLRVAGAPVNAYPSTAAWLQNVQMLSSAAAAGRMALVMTKTWSGGTAAQKDAWHRFAAASFLLGAAGADAFTFLATPGPAAAPDPYLAVPIGRPLGGMTEVGGAYQRAFSEGKVVVNPTGGTVTLALGGSYLDLAGVSRTVLSLPAHGAEILRQPGWSVQPGAAPAPGWRAGTLELVYTGADGAAYVRTDTAGSWAPPQTVGGRLVGAPAAVDTGTGAVDVLVRGTDNRLYLTTLSPGSQARWTDLGGVLTAAPAAAADGRGDLVVLVRGTDGALWSRTDTAASGWGSWVRIGGEVRVGTGPAALWTGATATAVVSGVSGGLWVHPVGGGVWTDLGGSAVGSPAAAPLPSGGAGVFVHGTDGQLWVRPAGTGGWQPLGGQLLSAPGAVGGAGRTDVFVTGLDGSFYQRTATSGGWTGWSRVG